MQLSIVLSLAAPVAVAAIVHKGNKWLMKPRAAQRALDLRGATEKSASRDDQPNAA